jgi:hypothetical protein
MMESDGGWDFFISYNQADRAWAEWIAWQLEERNYRVLVQAWDFVPGSNWIFSMQEGVTRSERMIAVLSQSYVQSSYGSAEWQAIWAQDPTGVLRKLITMRVTECERPGLLAGVVGIDLFQFGDESAAASAMMDALETMVSGRRKPHLPPPFPIKKAVPGRAPFPRRTMAIDHESAGDGDPPGAVEVNEPKSQSRRRLLGDLSASLQAVPYLVNVQVDIVTQLEEEFGHRVSFEQEKAPALLAFRLVTICSRSENGLRVLAEIIDGYARGTPESREFNRLVERWYRQ